MLLDRLTERSELERLLDAARGGQGGVLVLRGEAGTGKTALLDYAVTQASGFSVCRAAGAQRETNLAFGVLHQLCAPLLDRLPGLPEPQRDALSIALGLRAGKPPDQFLVELAVVGLMPEAAGRQPLLITVDNAQWADPASAQAVAFLARRMPAHPAVLLIAARVDDGYFAGLPTAMVQALDGAAAAALLRSVLRGPVDQRVLDRFLAEARGIPQTLLQVPKLLPPFEVAGGFGLPSSPVLPGQLEEFQQRYGTLPETTRRLLLVAAADPLGDPVLLWQAAARLGITADAVTAAEADGLLSVGMRVTFQHPMARPAIYAAASPVERRAAHQALAEVTNPLTDPARRVWHRAKASPGPDEPTARELEESSGLAQELGGLTASAAFLERSAMLTQDPAKRAERALAAALALAGAGAVDSALALLAIAESVPLDERLQARVQLIRGQIALLSGRGGDALRMLIEAAEQLQRADPDLAGAARLEAFKAALAAGRFAAGTDLRELARDAAPSRPPQVHELLVTGLALLATESYTAGVPLLKRAVSASRGQDGPGPRWLGLATHASVLLWDDDSWDVLTSRFLQLVRESGAFGVLPFALSSRAVALCLEGAFAAADALVAEIASVTEITRCQVPPYGALVLAAVRGREHEAVALFEAGAADISSRHDQVGLDLIHWASAMLSNSLGRYQDALASARRLDEDHAGDQFVVWALTELIEAAVRSGQIHQARDAFTRLSRSTRSSGTSWALGIEARSRALLSGHDGADPLYRGAIRRLGRTRMVVELGRAHLLYGEWLRRQRRLRDARSQLHTAHEIFESLGAEALADRAGAELRALGSRAEQPAGQGREALTAQEMQVARLASAGGSNAEIAAQMFISQATVAYHLRKVFTKLGISSRRQLRDRVLGGAAGPQDRPVMTIRF